MGRGGGVGEREGKRERGEGERVRGWPRHWCFALQAHVVPRSSWLASRT